MRQRELIKYLKSELTKSTEKEMEIYQKYQVELAEARGKSLALKATLEGLEKESNDSKGNEA